MARMQISSFASCRFAAESKMLRFVIVALLLALPANASAQTSTTTYRDWAGREVGTATRSGNRTTFRDRFGREVGTASKKERHSK